MKGKERCKILKEIRQKIADENDIAFVTSECKHKGECLGTCPKCESEIAYLERELNRRRALGKAVSVAGLAVVTAVSGGCLARYTDPPLQGDIAAGSEQTEATDALMGVMEKYPDECTDELAEGEIIESAVIGEIAETTEEDEYTGDMGVILPDATEQETKPLETVEALMGDIAFLPPPDLAFLVTVCETEKDYARELYLCRQDDMRSYWEEYLVDRGENCDTFLLPSGERSLILSYDESGYVKAVEIKEADVE